MLTGEARLEALASRQRNLMDHLRLLLAEGELLDQVMGSLEPGVAWPEAGRRLFTLCQRPFDLSGFYLARACWEEGVIRFPYFYEAGRDRPLDPVPLSADQGLTGRGIFAEVPIYLDSFEACCAEGMRLTDPELETGLCTKSWLGVPMAGPEADRPRGLMGFHSFLPAAFPEDRRRLMGLIGGLAAHRLG